jgi:exonuclease VII large subunit
MAAEIVAAFQELADATSGQAIVKEMLRKLQATVFAKVDAQQEKFDNERVRLNDAQEKRFDTQQEKFDIERERLNETIAKLIAQNTNHQRAARSQNGNLSCFLHPVRPVTE